jgi:hypothetical protein
MGLHAHSPMAGTSHELTENELRSLKAPLLVELVLESREQKNEL